MNGHGGSPLPMETNDEHEILDLTLDSNDNVPADCHSKGDVKIEDSD